MEITKPLTDIETTESSTITLECEVSKSDVEATWTKNKTPIKHGGRFEIIVDGTVHKLIIKDVLMEDKAKYTITVADKKSSAEVFVSEEVVEFIRELQNVEVSEIPGTAVFDIELSKPDVTVQWLCQGKPVIPDNKHDIIADGKVHTLTVKDVDDEDEGEYSVTAKGKTSTAQLSVQGEKD